MPGQAIPVPRDPDLESRKQKSTSTKSQHTFPCSFAYFLLVLIIHLLLSANPRSRRKSSHIGIDTIWDSLINLLIIEHTRSKLQRLSPKYLHPQLLYDLFLHCLPNSSYLDSLKRSKWKQQVLNLQVVYKSRDYVQHLWIYQTAVRDLLHHQASFQELRESVIILFTRNCQSFPRSHDSRKSVTSLPSPMIISKVLIIWVHLLHQKTLK